MTNPAFTGRPSPHKAAAGYWFPFDFHLATTINSLVLASRRTMQHWFFSLTLAITDNRFRKDHSFHAASNCNLTVSGSFNSPFGVLFSFGSRYYFAIGLKLYLELGVDPPIFTPTFLQMLLFSPLPFALTYGTITLFGCAFPALSVPQMDSWVPTSLLHYCKRFRTLCLAFSRSY